MTERLIDIRTELAASPRTRVEIGQDGVLHVLAGPITLHLDRAVCEELTTTLARAMVALSRHEPSSRPPRLRLLRRPDVTSSTPSAGREHIERSSDPEVSAGPAPVPQPIG